MIRASSDDLPAFGSPTSPASASSRSRSSIQPELLAEELRWSDEDDVYAATAKRLLALTGDRA